ncbi:MAG TPA: acyl-CoA dehydrogenase family protein [Solirubrobacteraceae bacterium]|nr:acyl-CoA dehydrogenase family protein [Solirubrobacteraceae bacterium]
MAKAMVHDTAVVLDAVREVAEARVAPAAAEVDRTSRFPEEELRALADVGGLGLLVASEHGGAGGGLSTLVRSCEAVGQACASTGMAFLMHAVASATVGGGGGSRAGDQLARMASGEALGTLAFSERGTGAHFYAPELRVERRNGEVRVSGRKSFVTSGGHADVMLVLVRSEEEGLDCYAVERSAEGVRFEGSWEGLGMRGNASVGLELEDVALEPEARIGPAGAGADLVFGVVAPTFLAGLAAVNVGIAQAAVSATVAHATSRSYPDGATLAELPTIQHALADMDADTRSARALLREAATLGDAGDEAALVALMEAKVRCTETGPRVTQQALEVCGGQGYTPSLPIERHLRDARAGAVMAPTNGVLRTWIGKALAGLPVP